MTVKHWPVCLLPFDFSLLFALLPDFDVIIIWSAGPVQDGAGGGSQVDVSVLLGPHAPGLQTPRARPSHTPKSYNHWSLENHHVLPRFYKTDFFFNPILANTCPCRLDLLWFSNKIIYYLNSRQCLPLSPRCVLLTSCPSWAGTVETGETLAQWAPAESTHTPASSAGPNLCKVHKSRHSDI